MRIVWRILWALLGLGFGCLVGTMAGLEYITTKYPLIPGETTAGDGVGLLFYVGNGALGGSFIGLLIGLLLPCIWLGTPAFVIKLGKIDRLIEDADSSWVKYLDGLG